VKIKSENLINFIKNKSNNFRFILLYGPNIGLVNLLFNKVISELSIDVKNPFNVSKFYTHNLIDYPSILTDTVTTFTMTSDKRIILLDLSNNSPKKKYN
jgi:DNA polymerase III delta subunit